MFSQPLSATFGNKRSVGARKGRRYAVYARVNILEGPPDKIDGGMRFFRENVLPELKQTDGFKGTISLHDRQSGKTLGITFWESEEHIRATEEAAKQRRGEVAEAAGEASASVEAYEVGFFEVEDQS
jgi:heme-degrading monooxygenase HmoA